MTRVNAMTLGDQYLASRSHRAEWQGQDVWGSVVMTFDRPVELSVDCQVTELPVRQGICIRFPKRRARIAGVEGERFVLWADHAQFPVQVTMLASRGPFTLRVWNCWEGKLESLDAWIGNAGMQVVSEEPGRVAFACSAGVGEVDFHDLSMAVTWPAEVAATLVQ